MLIKIPTSELTVGMFLKKLDGNWVDHPFWKSSFVITSRKDIDKIQSSSVKFAWIDDSKGKSITKAQKSDTNQSPKVSDLNVAQKKLKDGKTKEKINKPSTSQEMVVAKDVLNNAKQATESMFNELRMGNSINTENVESLINEINDSVTRNASALLCLTQIKNKDNYTYLHSVAVCALMIALGKQIGYEGDFQQLGMAGLLHDVGKMAIPEQILNKEGRLTAEEFDVVKNHPRRGYQFLLDSGQSVGKVPLDVCLHHHERVDGKGYPEGLTGEQLSIEAKMAAICDVYDAITSDRSYKKGWEPAESLKKMASWREGHFDDRLFKAFVKCIGIYPTGTLLMLRSSRLAIVVDQSDKSLLEPTIKIFYSSSSKSAIPIKITNLTSSGEIIEGIEKPKDWGFSRQFIIDLIAT